MKVFEECLPEKSKDVPAFLVKAVLSTSKYLCQADGEHIFGKKDLKVLIKD